MTPKEFLVALFDSKNDKHWIYLWELDKFGPKRHKTTAFQHIRAAAEYIDNEKTDNKTNCYFGVSISDTQPGKRGGRCDTNHISGLPGLYIDIDVAGPAHKKTNLPPDQKAALDLLNEFPFKPTLIVDSGNGLHAWWLFKEIWTFDSPQEREAARTELQRFQYTIKNIFAKKNWDIDSTFDLTRVLRPVGTINKKDGVEDKKVVCLEYEKKRRYNPGDFDEYLVDFNNGPGDELFGVHSTASTAGGRHRTGGGKLASPGAAGSTIAGGLVRAPGLPVTQGEKEAVASQGLIFDETRQPDLDKFMALTEVFAPTFKLTWDHAREDDPKLKDKSPSGYDYALMNMAVQAGYSDQDMLDLCISFRRKHGFDLKFNNKQYYVTSLARIRKNTRDNEVLKDIETASAVIGTPYEQLKNTESSVCNLLGLQSFQLFLYESDPVEYVFIINGIEVRTKNRKAITRLTEFGDIIMSVSLKDIKVTNKQWVASVRGLVLSMVQRKSVEDDLTLVGTVVELLSTYLSSRTAGTFEQRFMSKDAFFHTDGHWYFFAEKFYEWIRCNSGSIVSKNDVITAAKKINAKSTKFNVPAAVTETGRKSSTNAWQVPTSIMGAPTKSTGIATDSGLSNIVNLADKMPGARNLAAME